jgi:cell division protein ZapA
LNKQSVDVTIFGDHYTLSASSDEQAEHLKKIAKYVDKKMVTLSDQLSLTSVTKIAILTALNLANEIIDKDDQQFSKSVDDSTIEKLISKIESCFGEQTNFLADTGPIR